MPKRTTSLAERFNEKWEPVPHCGCWIWTAYTGPHGYGRIGAGGKYGEILLAHRVAWMLHRGDPGQACVLHRCDVRPCVNPDHLFLGTRDDNMKDAVAKGRISKGSHRPRSIVTEQDIPLIRQARLRGESPASIGLRFGLTRQGVYSIVTGRSWRHII